ncbi:MAG TPA: Hsp20/alpha crystallin family protein [Caulobacteraceae bacterium]|nr:Hsp20/alpha crystallin family protein [Caulobacteraceae bacterium]
MTMPAQIPVKYGTAAAQRPFAHMFGSLQREIDRLFDDFTPAFYGGWPSFSGQTFNEAGARMDLAQTKDGFELTIEVPGMEEKDVNVAVEGGVLTVSGEKKFDSEKKDKKYHFVERGYGAFTRSIDLPAGVKPADIQATLAKGVLKVTIPAPKVASAKKIEVQAA